MLRVLVIDDEPPIRRMLKRILEQDYEVILEGTYNGGLARLSGGCIDVCLTDQRLESGQTGLELLAEAHSKGCAVPTILITGLDDVYLDLVALEHGAVAYLHKTDLFNPGCSYCDSSDDKCKSCLGVNTARKILRASIEHANNAGRRARALVDQLNDLKTKIAEQNEEIGRLQKATE